MIPPAIATPPTIGPTGRRCSFSLLTSSGPSFATFSFVVKLANPPQASATIPATMRMMPRMPAGFISARSECAPALNQIDDQDDDGDHKQDVNETAERV